MLNIKTADDARKESIERAERKVEKDILEAQERGEMECNFLTPIPFSIISQLREKGYLVSDDGQFVSWQ